MMPLKRSALFANSYHVKLCFYEHLNIVISGMPNIDFVLKCGRNETIECINCWDEMISAVAKVESL